LRTRKQQHPGPALTVCAFSTVILKFEKNKTGAELLGRGGINCAANAAAAALGPISPHFADAWTSDVFPEVVSAARSACALLPRSLTEPVAANRWFKSASMVATSTCRPMAC